VILGPAQDVTQTLALPRRRIECRGEEGGIQLLIGIAVNHPRCRHHSDGASVGVHHHHLAGGFELGVVEPRQLAGRREEERHAVQVVPCRNGRGIEHPLVRPAAFTTVADVVDEECPFAHLPVDRLLRFGITLTSGRGHLGVGIHEDAFDVEGPVVRLHSLGMADAV